MAFKILKLECLTDWPNNNLTARIERHDGQYYDPKSKTFQPVEYFVDGNTPMIVLISGSGFDQWKASASVDIDPTQFTNGEYTIYYHDNTNLLNGYSKLFDGSQVTIINGNTTTPTTTDIAIRIMRARIGDTTVRKALEEIHARIQEIKVL